MALPESRSMSLASAEPTATLVAQTRARIAGHVIRTPLLSNQALDDRLGARVYFKAENLQRTGAFKFRGAINRLLQLSQDQARAGVVTWSSGNHGAALSYGARLLGVRATVLMPIDAPQIKIEGVRANGALVRLYDKASENREEIGQAISSETGAVIVPPYDDPHVIAGQATLGAELVEQVAALGPDLDTVLLPCSGGGLASGVACAVRSSLPKAQVFSVEPEGYDCVARSLAAGSAIPAPADRPSICDALLVATPGKLTWPICAKHLAGGLTVNDAEVAIAMQFAFRDLKLVVEPGGAVALAAVLAGKIDLAGQVAVVVLSGGNVDPLTFASLLGKGATN